MTLKIAYVTTYDARDPSIGAGTGYHIAKALEAQGCTLEYIGPLRERLGPYFKARTLLYRKLARRAFHRDREPLILEGYARQVEARLARSDAQIVFGPSTIPLARLRTKLPIAFWPDATYAAVQEAYVWELPAAERSKRLGHAMEAEALRKTALSIYSSDWAARSAIERYGADPRKVKVVPYGANVTTSRSADEIERLIDSRARDRWQLLFIGTGWERKGGDIAVELARRLNDAGLPTELNLLGQLPANLSLPDYVKRVGFIDKSSAEGRARFDDLFGS